MLIPMMNEHSQQRAPRRGAAGGPHAPWRGSGVHASNRAKPWRKERADAGSCKETKRKSREDRGPVACTGYELFGERSMRALVSRPLR
eukprot:6675861-Prymnesium_polylepis.1